MTEQTTQSYLVELLATTRGKIVTMLVIAALVLGIAGEAMSLYRGWQETQINAAQIQRARADACLSRGKFMKEVALLPGADNLDALTKLAKECSPDIIYGK